METEILKKYTKKNIKSTGIDPKVEEGPVPEDTIVRTPGLRRTQGGDHRPSAEKGPPQALRATKIKVKTLKKMIIKHMKLQINLLIKIISEKKGKKK